MNVQTPSEWLGANIVALFLCIFVGYSSENEIYHGMSLAIFGTVNPKTASFVRFD